MNDNRVISDKITNESSNIKYILITGGTISGIGNYF